MRIIKHFSFLLAVAMTGSVLAQPGGMGQQVPSTVINPDNTVTFNYSNRNAKSVKVWTQFSEAVDMAKGANGVWTATIGPAEPDIYPYHFEVDGISVMDPQCAEWFPNETFKNSLLDMRGDKLSALKDVPHGSVDYLNYWSPGLKMFIPVIVYTPPFYDSPKNKDKKYPVMYLISGTTDTEEVYFKVGKMNLILDNLIAEGKAKEMILVLPYGNATLLKTEREPQRQGGGMGGFGGMGGGFGGMGGGYNFNQDFVEVLMPFVESNYRTINDADHRGIGGFSRGGNQGLAIGLSNLDKFTYLCSYSSFTQVRDSQFEDYEAFNKKVHLFWSGIGTDDFLYGNSKDLMQMLDKHNIKNVKVFTHDKFGHTWMNARYWLEKSFPLLFQDQKVIDKAVAESMSLEEAEKVRLEKLGGAEPSRLTGSLMTSLFPAGVKSPEYNADGSVTFRCQAPNAEKVALECQMFSGTKPMEKDDRGVWSITVKPDAPDIYPYAFQIDGTQVADPNNMHIFPNENFKYSLVDVRGEAPSVQDIQDVPHGKVSYRYYFSKACGIERPMCVYTPADYDPNGKEKLPVLYLIHGMTDTYETWFKVGQMNNILDNMIAKGEAKRMIVVMPYANPYPEMIAQGKATAYNATDVILTTKEFVEEVIPFIESNYNVIANADNRAIAGFSLGGRQTLAAGLGNPDKFHYVAAYAPAIFSASEYEGAFQDGTYAPIKDLQKKLKFMFLGTGKTDFLIQQSLGLDKYMTDNGLKHTFYNPEGGHTWMNCRDYLELTVKELFK
jgi:enterochelin esterase-like enzyme